MIAVLAALLAGCGGGGDAHTDGIATEDTAAGQEHAHALGITPQQAATARWSAVVPMSINPGNVSNLPGGKLAFWSGYQPMFFAYPGQGQTYSTIYDPMAGSFTDKLITATGHEMFCSGTTNLPDGRILVTGGQNAEHTSLFDASTNTWTAGATLNIPRGYNANTTLQDGSAMTVGGSFDGGVGGKSAEVYTPAGGWRVLTGVPEDPLVAGQHSSAVDQPDDHMWLIPAGNGRVLHAGPSQLMNWIDTRGNGSVSVAGLRSDDIYAMEGTTVMYDTGKILKMGGGEGYHNVESIGGAYVIDVNYGLTVRRLASPAYQRGMHNSVVLPNGQVVLIGGQTHQQGYVDTTAVLVPELFDPQSETFTPLPPMSQARSYHSVAILMPDGRVMEAGGNLGCDNSAGCPAHASMEILSPPYLFNADGSAAVRPVITAAPASTTYGNTLAVATDSPVTSFAMVRLSSTTHAVNNDQRRLSLAFTANGSNSYQVQIPTNPGWAIPGRWMLFAINANGVPSVSSEVMISNTGVPALNNPGDQSGTLGVSATLNLSATGATSYGATGLPQGVSINSGSGVISGTPSAPGNYRVAVFATNAVATVSTEFSWNVAPATQGNGKGLLGQFFGNATLSGPVVATTVGAPGFDSNLGPQPPAAVPIALFSTRYTGWLEPASTGPTQIQTIGDDGVRVWADGQLVIDDWSPHGPTADTVTINLTLGRRVPVMIEYFQGGGGATLQFNWQPAGASAMSAVPASRLYAALAPAPTNLALGKPALQSTVAYGGDPSRAVDGNTDGVYNDGSVIHTGDTQSWWQVDLQQPSRIDNLQIWNRTDCCATRLQNFLVFYSANDMSQRSLSAVRADPSVTSRFVGISNVAPNIGIPGGAVARYVRVQALGTDPLNIAEVQVWGSASFSVPSVTALAAQQSLVGNAVNLTPSGSDSGGGVLFWSASGLPAGLVIDPASGALTGTLVAAGSSSVTLTATNASGLQASTSFIWQVASPSNPIASLPAPIAATGSTVNYSPQLVPGIAGQFSWNFGDGSAVTAFSSSAATNHAYAAPGIYNVTLTVRFADGTSSLTQFQQAVSASGAAATAQAPASTNTLLEIRAGASARLWVVNQDNNSVSVFDTGNNAKLAEIGVGNAPRALALAADGRVWVTNKQDASISIISPSSLALVQTVALPRASQPFGVVVSPSDGSVFVALEATGQLLKLNGSTGAQTASLAVGPSPRHLALTPAADKLLVSRFITRPLPGEGTATVTTTDANGNLLGGEVLLVNPQAMTLTSTMVLRHSEKTDLENQGRGIPNYLGAPAISPDGTSAWVPSKQDNIKRGSLRDGNPLNFQSTVRAITSRLDLTTGAEDYPARVDHDNAGIPSAARYHPSGAYLFVALETNRQVAVIDPVGKAQLFRIEVGLAPQGLAFSADGSKLYVSNFMSRSVSVVDLGNLVNYGQAVASVTATLNSVASELLPAAVLKGKQLFYDARDTRLARDSYMSCASCHNDAGHDGRTWDFTNLGEGLRNTIALKGRAGLGQGFMHWSANFDEVQDFEGQIRNFAGGTGLMADADFNTGTRSQPLGDKKAGLSADLDALAAYMGSLTSFAPSPWRNADGTLSIAANAGKAVFNANCVSCHGGAAFTLSGDGTQAKNIGTIKASSGNRLGVPLTGIDIPTLRDAWATGPYLHDGSAATLSAAISAHNNVSLSANDLANVAAYVQQIGSDEPAAPLPAPAGTGLAASYFNGTALAGAPLLQRTEAVNFNWGAGSPAANIPVDYFSARWTGSLTATVSGPTQLQTLSDDGVRVWVGGVLVIDNWTLHGPTANTATVTLTAGVPVPVTVEYFENTGGATMTLSWMQQGATAFSLVPASALTPAVNVAQGQPTTQSSTVVGGIAARAVDGSTDGNWSDNSVTHSDLESQPWWQVDLGRQRSVQAVQLWNRTDCCADRLSNFYVLVSPADMTGRTLTQLLNDPSIRQVPVASLNGAATVVLPTSGATGRYVRVQLMGSNNLSLAEVQVLGQ